MNLSYLDLFDNAVVDLTPVSEMENMYHLDIGYNSVTDLSPLYELPQLTEFNVLGNPIDCSDPEVQAFLVKLEAYRTPEYQGFHDCN